MNMQELNTLFDAACNAQQRANSEGVTLWSCWGAGLNAVVEKLRAEMHADPGCCWACEDNEKLLKSILASDGTHGSPELDEDARKLEAMGQDAGPTVQDLFPEAFTPAAAPVCEWSGEPPLAYMGCKPRNLEWTNDRRKCPSCGKTIKFKEAAR